MTSSAADRLTFPDALLRIYPRRGERMSMPGTSQWTVEQLLALPEDGQRHELVYGEHLVTPAPQYSHQRILRRLFLLTAGWLEGRGLGEPLWSPADLTLAPDSLVQPDFFVVRPEEAKAADWKAVRCPLLVVEVLSPGTARQDRFTKRRLYLAVDVPHYWVVDPIGRAIELWTPAATSPIIVRDTLHWRPEGADRTLEIDVPALFAPPHPRTPSP
ncbi:MAG: Uma2 family endonuclease [Gemmatimonadales bacterium]